MYKKKLIGLLAAVLVLTGCGASTVQQSSQSYRQMTMADAMKEMEGESDYILLDVRTPEEYSEGHLIGAVNIPNETITEEPVEELPDRSQEIYIYCRSGNRSKQAAEKLAEQGYTDIVEIGGINAWDGPVEAGS